MPEFKLTEFGFDWGPMKFTRIATNERQGWVLAEVKTRKGVINILISKSGKIRVMDSKGEWVREEKEK